VVVDADDFRLCLPENLLFTSFTSVFTPFICIGNKLGGTGVGFAGQDWVALEGRQVLGCVSGVVEEEPHGSPFNTCHGPALHTAMRSTHGQIGVSDITTIEYLRLTK